NFGGLRRVDRVLPLLHLFLRVHGEVGFEGGRDDEEPVRVPKERSETRFVRQISLNSFDPRSREVLEFRPAPRQAEHSMPSLHELSRDCAALLPGRSRDQDGLGLSHSSSPRGRRTSAVLVGWTLVRKTHGERVRRATLPRSQQRVVFPETLGWGFEPQNTRLGGGCAIRATRPEHGRRQGLLGLRLFRPLEPCCPVSGFCPRPGTPGEEDRRDPRATVLLAPFREGQPLRLLPPAWSAWASSRSLSSGASSPRESRVLRRPWQPPPPAAGRPRASSPSSRTPQRTGSSSAR